MSSAAETQVRKLAKLSSNCTCPNCGCFQKHGFSTVCIKFHTFVCNDCKSSHQAISHRCKSLTMSSWSVEEVLELQSKGNEYCLQTWLQHAPPCGQGGRPQPGSDISVYKSFVVNAYENRKYYGEHDGTTTLESQPATVHAKKLPARRPIAKAPASAPLPLVADLLDFSTPTTASTSETVSHTFAADFGDFASAPVSTASTTAPSVSNTTVSSSATPSLLAPPPSSAPTRFLAPPPSSAPPMMVPPFSSSWNNVSTINHTSSSTTTTVDPPKKNIMNANGANNVISTIMSPPPNVSSGMMPMMTNGNGGIMHGGMNGFFPSTGGINEYPAHTVNMNGYQAHTTNMNGFFPNSSNNGMPMNAFPNSSNNGMSMNAGIMTGVSNNNNNNNGGFHAMRMNQGMSTTTMNHYSANSGGSIQAQAQSNHGNNQKDDPFAGLGGF